MNERLSPFVFLNDLNQIASEQDFVLKVPGGLATRLSLLSHYEQAGQFPSYFGRNWDALSDCLRDFSWISQMRIIIAHNGLPLRADEKSLMIYLDLLGHAVEDWRIVRDGPFAKPPEGMSLVKHELIVSFPASDRSTVASLRGRVLQ